MQGRIQVEILGQMLAKYHNHRNNEKEIVRDMFACIFIVYWTEIK